MSFRFHLVSMPWHALGMAPLSLALVRGTLARSHPQAAVAEHFCNIRWAEYLLTATGGRVTPEHYQDVADNGIELGLGDWVFAGSLYGNPGYRDAELRRYAAERGADIGMTLEMREFADDFVEAMATEIVAASPDAVGFTTTFMQNVPSLALAKRIKQKSAGIVIIFGGANCDGTMGAALHRNHPFVDYVVRGEAEAVLPTLVDVIQAGSDANGLDGVCWWRDGVSVANPQVRPAVPPDLIPDASYDAWHDAFKTSPVRQYTEPYLVLEGSRGCWWGERHHCTFCGLNGSSIGYRSKPAGRLWSELERLVTRYRILDIVTSDNIMNVRYFTELLPLIAQAGWDLRIHYELKANVTEEQIALLASAGVTMVQFGIENFSSRVLTIMDKGVRGATAVRVLRDSQDHGVSVTWNYLYGFPGERAGDYLDVIAQMPALVHLQPPDGPRGSRIGLQRFSPNFEDPELGFRNRRPADFYAHVYDLPAGEISDLAYYFDCPDEGIGGDVEDTLNKALARWKHSFPDSHLHVAADDSSLLLRDCRVGWPDRIVELTGWPRAAYGALRRPRSTRSLQKWLAAEGTPTDETHLRQWLDSMRDQGLVFCDADSWVALATQRVHAKLAGP